MGMTISDSRGEKAPSCLAGGAGGEEEESDGGGEVLASGDGWPER